MLSNSAIEIYTGRVTSVGSRLNLSNSSNISVKVLNPWTCLTLRTGHPPDGSDVIRPSAKESSDTTRPGVSFGNDAFQLAGRGNRARAFCPTLICAGSTMIAAILFSFVAARGTRYLPSLTPTTQIFDVSTYRRVW